MPAAGVVATSLTTPGTAPFSLFVGAYDLLATVGASLPSVPMDSIRFEDNGAEVGAIEFDVVDMALAAAITDCAPIRFEDNVAGATRWVGEVTHRAPTIIASGRAVHVSGTHAGQYLDKSLVPSDFRNNDSATFNIIGQYGESDRQRLGWLLAAYGGRLGSRDASFLARLLAFDQGASLTGTILPVQRFLGLTLRQAIEQVEGQISTNLNATYYVSGPGRLHHLDGSAGDLGAAPYAIRIGTPGGGEIAPEDLLITYDSSNLRNAYYVKGANAAGSGWVTDITSILAYGRHEDYIDAPDADTASKRDAVGNAALADTKNPVPRGSFTAKSPYNGWAGGQTLTINSAPQFGISSPTTYRIVTVVTEFLSGVGDRHYDVSFGAPRASLVRQN